MDLALVAHGQDRLAALAAAIEAKHGVRAVPVPTDLALPDCAERIRAGVEAAGLTVGLLVNNAGYGLFGNFFDRDPADQAAMVDVNCRAPAMLARRFAPDMKARGRGGIIFVASTAAYQPTPYMATYSATKVFDLFLAEALWAELAGHGVEVLALSPGHVRTGFQARSGDPIRNPPGGVSTPEAIVATALAALGKKPSVISGWRNVAMTRLIGLLPRKTVMRSAIGYFDRISQKLPKREAPPPARPLPQASTNGHANWFDHDYSAECDSKLAEELLASIARNPRLIQAVAGAMQQFEARQGQPGGLGPSRSQLIREAIAAVLNEG